MLKIENISVKVNDKDVLNNLSLNIEPGTIHAIMGPNGVGKSTLTKTILGNIDYKITNGNIIYKGESINKMSIEDRANKGIFVVNQNPTVIEGVNNKDFLITAYRSKFKDNKSIYEINKEIDSIIKDLEFNNNIKERNINEGFSGGEKKKNEILQLRLLKPEFIILDEVDSGLDVDSLNIVCDNILKYKKENKNVSIIIITHYPRILEKIKPNFVHILKNGTIIKTGDYSLAKLIEKEGYNSTNIVEEF